MLARVRDCDEVVKATNALNRPDQGTLDGNAKESPTAEQSRGKALPQEELVRIAGLEGPYAMQKPMAQLLAKLRSEPHRWKSIFKLCGGRKGKAHSDAKKNLGLLMEKRLAEKQPDGVEWRLGAAAFPDKGATKGATI